LPTGIVDVSHSSRGINTIGIQFYDALIDELLRNDIQPWVTLFHWDLPQSLDELCGGWLNRSCTVDAFVDYSRIIFASFGDRVKHFITINEAWTM
jgi:beta-glucosidase